MSRALKHAIMTAIFVGLVSGEAALAQSPGPPASPSPATRRAALLLARSLRTAAAASSTVLIGVVWSSTDQPMVGLGIRLREISEATVVAATETNQDGEFGFQGLPAGSYLIEVTRSGEDETVMAVGQMVTVVPGETIATFIRMPPPLTWHDTAAALLGGAGATQVGSAAGSVGTFGGTAVGVVSTATSAGLTGLANFGFDATGER